MTIPLPEWEPYQSTPEGYLALDWLIRQWLPAFLLLSPVTRPDSDRLRSLREIHDRRSARRAGAAVAQAKVNAQSVIDDARSSVWVTTGAQSVAQLVIAAGLHDASMDAGWHSARTLILNAAAAAAWGGHSDQLAHVVAALRESVTDLADRMTALRTSPAGGGDYA